MNKTTLNILLIVASSFVFSFSLMAKEFLSPAELEKWFNSDDELPTSKVNEGQLNFINPKPNGNIFHSAINITIDQVSIDDGWTTLTQCYSNLDAVPRTAVTYRKNLVKNLRVISSKNIKRATVSANKVYLKDVTKG
ncbi:MAG: hypothetical protein OEY78_04685, partial [Gammaproteobacteria bacterium]|nr:hypothetical protein [Gammaproteobacteria bacterium]